MDFRKLGQTELKVSILGLGTMTYGDQNSEAEAHQQLDTAVAAGINLIDTAELYPVPPSAESYGASERFIGSWLARSGKRHDVVLASKIAGRPRHGEGQYIRGGSRFSREHIIAACEASLKRLQTDYLDLYQLHWPERHVNYFGQLGLSQIDDPDDVTSWEEVLSALDELKAAGKIRYYGLSNETPWGVMQCLQRAQRSASAAQLVSVQNPYNLLNRSYEVGLAEISLREHISLLAYSPLAFGVLTGKYSIPEAEWSPAWRIARYKRFQRYCTQSGWQAVDRYAEIAREAGLSLVELALAFINQQAFVASNIIGVVTLRQLKENLKTVDLRLSDDVLNAINAVHADISNPCP